MTGNNGFLNQLIDELEKRERLNGSSSATQNLAGVALPSVAIPAAITGNVFSTPLDAIAPPVQELTSGIQELTGQVKNLRDATQANVENVETNTKALELSMDAIRSIGLGAGEKAGFGLGGAVSLFPLFKGIKSLFDGDEDEVAVSAVTAAPTVLQPAEYGLSGKGALSYGERGTARTASPQQIHVHVQTLDSRSFTDNSEKIAEAVRTAMLQSGALNDVWGEY